MNESRYRVEVIPTLRECQKEFFSSNGVERSGILECKRDEEKGDLEKGITYIFM